MGEETHNLLSIGRLQAPIDNPLIQLILLIPSNNSPLLNQFFHIILNSTVCLERVRKDVPIYTPSEKGCCHVHRSKIQ